MSVAPSPSRASSELANNGAGSANASARREARRLLFDISAIDLSGRMGSRTEIERFNPHRGQMAMLDAIVWHLPNFTKGIGVKHVRDDEFWVAGHFPDRPMMPGVLMVECGAQLASYLFNIRFPETRIAAFIRLEDCTFRASVEPGNDFYLLAKEIKFSPKRFVSDIQGLVNGKIAFEARITGIAL
ncbi:MAG: hypothetical protein H7Y88_02715 [Phycisphaerales bacterium]|nr:hypothetical protein [Phycisphaerales bacterium]